MRRHFQRALLVAAIAGVALTLGVSAWAIVHNRGAIQRSCEVLNAAIVKSQEPPKPLRGHPNPNEVLIQAILDGKPTVARAYKRALKYSKPFLPVIDCKRVASDPDYQPYK